MENNIFKLLKIESNENFHSRFIASILEKDVNAKKLFINMLKRIIEPNPFRKGEIHLDYEKYKIQNEKILNNGENDSRSDIYITDYQDINNTGNTRIIIENKIFACDQFEQLFRYHKHLKDKNYSNSALFYLTLEGKDATNYSKQRFKTNEFLSKQKDYYLLSYNEHIKKWLNDVLDEETIEDKLKIYIQDYLTIINEITSEWAVLKLNFDKDEEAKTLKERTFLELEFWNYIENEILIKTKKYNVEISNKRLYSYEKMLHCQNNKSNQRDYGIIFKLNEEVEIRIGVKAQQQSRFQLFISKGKMNIEINKWEEMNSKILYSKTNKLINKSTMIKIGQEIINELNELYQFPNKIDK